MLDIEDPSAGMLVGSEVTIISVGPGGGGGCCCCALTDAAKDAPCGHSIQYPFPRCSVSPLPSEIHLSATTSQPTTSTSSSIVTSVSPIPTRFHPDCRFVLTVAHVRPSTFVPYTSTVFGSRHLMRYPFPPSNIVGVKYPVAGS